ncbi:MAG: hypothetical protein KatS3mg076_1159 [Candidatus Binatia bacterium]|nr:MAG: hypothetical protein KatS3mg076_1159 [Candidatus Binatia bacterium]
MNVPVLAPPLLLPDSHCHLDRDSLPSREAAVQRARASRVLPLVAVGVGGIPAILDTIRLAEENPDIVATVGIHPHDAKTADEKAFAFLEERAGHPRVAALGETGLDFHYRHSAPREQTEAFRKTVALARKVRLPLVLHVRDAYPEAARVLREERGWEVGGMVHCFTGDRDAARAFLELGFLVSFSGVVTFRDAEKVRDAARYVPAERLLLETDSPYLAPVPLRGRANEPSFLLHTAALVASLRGSTLEKLAETVLENTCRLFRLVRANDAEFGVARNP